MDYPPGAPPTPPPSTPTLTCEPEPGTPATTDPAGAVTPPAGNGLAAAALDDSAKQQVSGGGRRGWQLWAVRLGDGLVWCSSGCHAACRERICGGGAGPLSKAAGEPGEGGGERV